MIQDSIEPTNNHVKVTHFSFAVPDWESSLLTYLLDYKAKGGNISALVRDSLKVTMNGEVAPKWFTKYVEALPIVQQAVEIEEVKVELGGLFDDQ